MCRIGTVFGVLIVLLLAGTAAVAASTASRSCSRGATHRRVATSTVTTRSTPADAAIALAIAAGGSASCDPATLAAADVSGDNRVTSLDALMILQAAADAIEL